MSLLPGPQGMGTEPLLHGRTRRGHQGPWGRLRDGAELPVTPDARGWVLPAAPPEMWFETCVPLPRACVLLCPSRAMPGRAVGIIKAACSKKRARRGRKNTESSRRCAELGDGCGNKAAEVATPPGGGHRAEPLCSAPTGQRYRPGTQMRSGIKHGWCGFVSSVMKWILLPAWFHGDRNLAGAAAAFPRLPACSCTFPTCCIGL